MVIYLDHTKDNLFDYLIVDDNVVQPIVENGNNYTIFPDMKSYWDYQIKELKEEEINN